MNATKQAYYDLVDGQFQVVIRKDRTVEFIRFDIDQPEANNSIGRVDINLVGKNEWGILYQLVGTDHDYVIDEAYLHGNGIEAHATAKAMIAQAIKSGKVWTRED